MVLLARAEACSSGKKYKKKHLESEMKPPTHKSKQNKTPLCQEIQAALHTSLGNSICEHTWNRLWWAPVSNRNIHMNFANEFDDAWPRPVWSMRFQSHR